MAKKKKHRKKVKSHRKAPRQSASSKQKPQKSSQLTPAQTETMESEKKPKSNSKKPTKASNDPADAPGFDTQIMSDIRLSLSLAVGIVAVFIVLWLILQYTSFGQNLHLLIKL